MPAFLDIDLEEVAQVVERGRGVAEQPLLFHYGQRSLFPLVSEAVRSVIPLDKLRWTTCSHVEADESGALNQWLAAAPNAIPAHGQIGCNIWLTDISTWSQMNEVWDAWVAPGNAPARATVEAKLAAPGLKVEIMVQAAK